LLKSAEVVKIRKKNQKSLVNWKKAVILHVRRMQKDTIGEGALLIINASVNKWRHPRQF